MATQEELQSKRSHAITVLLNQDGAIQELRFSDGTIMKADPIIKSKKRKINKPRRR